MTRPLIPFVQNGYYASRNWIPLVKGNGFTASGGGEQEEVWETASGSIVTFDAVAAPLRQLSVAVEPVQSGTGDPSPTNVRPITGFDSVTVYHSGADTSNSTVYTIQLGETVYGGTLDVVNGKMTVDSRYFVADGTNITTTGGYGSAGKNWLPAIILPTGSKAVASAVNVLADSLKTSGSVQSVENSIAIGNSGAVIVLHIGTMQGTDGTHGYNSTDEVHAAVKTYLQSNPIGIWYRLATPFELTMTPEQISTVQGTNNVWSDAGDVTVEYRAQ